MNRGRKKIKLDIDTIEKLLDECYQEANDLKIETSNLFNDWNNKVSELGEIAAVGKDIIKTIDQRDKLIDKKLKITLQIQSFLSDKKKLEIAEFNSKNNVKSKEEDTELSVGVIPDNLDKSLNDLIKNARKNK